MRAIKENERAGEMKGGRPPWYAAETKNRDTHSQKTMKATILQEKAIEVKKPRSRSSRNITTVIRDAQIML